MTKPKFKILNEHWCVCMCVSANLKVQSPHVFSTDLNHNNVELNLRYK